MAKKLDADLKGDEKFQFNDSVSEHEVEEIKTEWVNEWEEIKSIIEINAIDGLYQNATAYVGDELAKGIKSNLKILIVGCRNSDISKHIYEDGYR